MNIDLPFQPLLLIVTSQPGIIRLHHISPLLDRNNSLIRLIKVREQHIRTLLIEPFQLLSSQREYATQYQAQTSLRVFLGIRKRECRAPASAENYPFLYLEVFAKCFDVCYEMPGCVVFQTGMGS